MRYLVWFVASLVFLVVMIFVAAFTPVGNSFVKPIIESRISQEIQMQSRLTTFALSPNSIEALLETDSGNSIKIQGKYSLFSQSFDLLYEVGFKNLKSLESLAQMPLRGAFYTNGTVKGDLSLMKIEGTTDIAEGKTLYFAQLQDLQPTSIIAKTKNAKLASLLYLAGKNPYAAAEIDLDINLKNITPHAMDGEIKLKSKNGTINPQFMKSDFNVTIPKTSFSLDLDAKLKGDAIDYSGVLSSNLLKINSSGKVALEPLRLDVAYVLDIQNLEALKPVTNADIRGDLKLQGTAKGSKEDLVLKGKSDLASSNTLFEASLKDFAPVSLQVKIQDLKIEELLYMLKQPKLLEADVSANIHYDLVEGKGKIISQIEGARFMQNQTFDLVKQFVKFDLYRELFRGNADIKIDAENIVAAVDLISKDAAIKTEQTKINTKRNSIDADVMLRVKKDELHARLSGDIDSPKVTIDLEKFMKTQAGQEVQEKINKEVDRLFQKLLK